MMSFLRRRIIPTVMVTATCMGVVGSAQAADQYLDEVSIVSVSVNGGADSVNPGTACIKVAAAVSAACPLGYVAIQNNNKLLIATAMQAKATSSKVWFYYNDASGSHHCPGKVHTPCSVINIELK